jgi:uncharacterized membrane protein
VVILLIIAALASIFAVSGRLGQDLSIDEPFTAMALHQDRIAFHKTLTVDNLPAYYGLLHGWVALVGASDWGMRSLSVAVYAMAVVVVGLTAAELADTPAAVLAALFMACSTKLGLSHAATARPYALLGCLAAMALWLHVRLVDRPSLGVAITAVVVHTLGLFTHPSYALMIGACVLGPLAVATHWRDRGRAFLPLLSLAVYLGLWWPVVALGLVPRFWTVAPRSARRAWVCICVVGLSALAAAILISLTLKPIYAAGRTPMLILPAASVAFGVILTRGRSTLLPVAVAAWLLVDAVWYTAVSARGPDPAPSAASLRAVLSVARCGDRIVATGYAFAAVSYFAGRVGVPACLRIDAFPADVREHPAYFDVARFISHPEGAREEAQQLVATVPPGGRLWVFGDRDGYGSEAAELLDHVGLPLEQTLPLVGTGFSVVRLYARPADER